MIFGFTEYKEIIITTSLQKKKNLNFNVLMMTLTDARGNE